MARQAFSSLPSARQSKPNGRRQARSGKRTHLDALARAESSTHERTNIKQSRLRDLQDGPDERSSKRRKVDGSEAEDDEDHSDERGSDSEGNEWHYGVDADDDDSDIDSDEALGESDDERFEGFAFRGSSTSKTKTSKPSRRPLKKATRPLNLSEGDESASDEMEGVEVEEEEEDDDDDDDSLGEDAVDLVTALDMNEAAEREEQKTKEKRARRKAHEAGDGTEDEGSDETESEEQENDTQSSIFSAEEEENAGAGDYKKLVSFVADLEGQTSKLKKSGNRQTASYMFEKPSEFGIKPTKKLTAADLLPTVTDPQLRQSLKMLHNADKGEPASQKKGISGKLAPPLARRQQDRLDRAAAYEKSKETLNRWIDTVKQNRRAEHISFPLPDPSLQSTLGQKQLLPTNSAEPMTDLESAIRNIMVESGLAAAGGKSEEDTLRAFEELQEKSLPIEEVQQRRAELRKARDLMFREEMRARRLKKIKSKAYRRVHRKERDKMAQEERSAAIAAGIYDSEDEREKNDRRRAEERMGARHRESKWAKGMKATGRAAWDEDARGAVTDMARRNEELRRRIEGKGAKVSDDEDLTSESESDDDKFSVESGESSTNYLDQKLRSLQGKDEEVNGSASRLSSLKFMQKAEASRKAANDAEIRQIREELGEDFSDSASDDERVLTGRRTYGGQKPGDIQTKTVPQPMNDFEAPLSDEEHFAMASETATTKVGLHDQSSTRKANTKGSRSRILMDRPTATQAPAGFSDDEPTDVPWLSGKSKAKSTFSGADVISTTGMNGGKAKAGLAAKKAKGSSSKASDRVLATMPDSDDEQVEVQNDQMTRNERLIGEALAADDAFEDFTREKEATAREEGDQVIDNSLPGWGSWAGEGISKKAQKAQKRNQARFKTVVKGVQEDKRRDAKLDRVIINEKKVRKNNKYLATELPHPFESKQQYERSLRQPLGKEFNTQSIFQDATKPRVLMKQGIIRPMDRPMV